MRKYQVELDRWFKANKWEYWDPLSILARLFEECGEFARLVNHLHGAKRKRGDEARQFLEEEIGDIIYTLVCYANSNGVDLDRAIRRSFDKVASRDRKRRFNRKKPTKSSRRRCYQFLVEPKDFDAFLGTPYGRRERTGRAEDGR